MMRSKLSILLVGAAAIAGCQHQNYDLPDRGLTAVNAPIVARANYALDVSAPGGPIAPSEAARLDAWFNGLGLRYGDAIYVDGPYADAARVDVARIAGQYGLMVAPGSPVTSGQVPNGSVRVIVSRAEARVPGCPNWDRKAQPNYNNQSMPSFGCAVNSNMAAMVANPEDLIHGREGNGVGDAAVSAKAVGSYWATPPSGTQGLQNINTKKDDK